MHANWKRKARALTAALLIVSAATLALPSEASAHGRKYSRHRIAHHGYARVHRPRYRHRSYYADAYRPYRTYYRPRYREVFVADPYCWNDDVYYVRPVYRSRPRVSLVISSGPAYYYGDPWCDW